MDRRDYNDEERDRFNNDGGGYIPRRRFNFSRSDYQNMDSSNSLGGSNGGDYSSTYSQPYSQANYQPTPGQPYQPQPQYQPQQPYPQQGYSPYPPQQQYVQQPQYVQYAQPMGAPTGQNMGQGQQPMGGQFSQDGGDFDSRSMAPPVGKKRGWFSRGKKQPQYDGDMQNILIVTPKTLSEVQDIIDNLRNRQAIIVEFNRINEKYAQRILDFLNGAIYALGGCEQRIADNMFLFTPGGVSIQGQIK